MERAQLYKITLLLAAAGHLAMATYMGLFPAHFFELCGLPQPLYPGLWQGIGLLAAAFGVAFLHGAFDLDWARPLVRIALGAKVIGVIGWSVSVAMGTWPIETMPLMVFADLVWVAPFAFLALEGTGWGRRVRSGVPVGSAALHALAAGWMVLLMRPGTSMEPDMAARLAWIGDHPFLWRFGWCIWIATAMSLMAFFAWWVRRAQHTRLAVIGWLIAIVGVVFEMAADAAYIGWTPQRGAWVLELETPLSVITAHGLYMVGGIFLTLASPDLPARPRLLAWAVWVSGLVIVPFQLLGMVEVVGGLFAISLGSFILMAWMLRRWRGALA